MEPYFGKLKRFKRLALRCEKPECGFAAIVALALNFILIKSLHTALAMSSGGLMSGGIGQS
ncbi:MAG: hypothetical protein ACAH27_06240 [Xanthobacteraceae bacterium]